MQAKTMKALVYRGPGEYKLEDVAVPQIIEPTDVIGRVTLSTICSSDVHVLEGHMNNVTLPKIIGHEFCAEIVEVGADVKELKVGDRVQPMPGIYCGTCKFCKAGVAIMCEHKDAGVLGANGVDGCQAEYVRIPMADKFCIKIPHGMEDEDILLLGDMMGTARYGLENASFKEGQSLAVIGVGPVGLSTCLLAKKSYGARQIIAIDLIQSRLDLALANGIADVALNPTDSEFINKFLMAAGGGVDAVIETAGTAQTLQMAFEMARPGGVVSNVAIFPGPVELPIPAITVKNITFRSGIQFCEGVEEILPQIQNGKIDTRFMLTHRAPLNDIIKGYDIFGNKKDGCVKWLVTPYKE
jgi:alcohol dehydrogenase